MTGTQESAGAISAAVSIDSLLGMLSGPDAFMEIKVLQQLLCPVDMYIKCLDIGVGTLAK